MRGWRALLAAFALGVLGAGTRVPPTPAPAGAEAAAGRAANSSARCELGILHAFAGDLARAESVFVALLSIAPPKGCALTNLGNLALLRGDPALALAFYDRAAVLDSADGGIRLNRAIALALEGHEAESQDQAREGIELAGGPAAAGSLLGLRAEEGRDRRGSASGRLTREEVRSLLRNALAAFPADSTLAARPRRAPFRPEPPRRSAGPRAARPGDAIAPLYWKR